MRGSACMPGRVCCAQRLSVPLLCRPIRKWEDALREQGVAAPEASSAQLSVAQLIELHKSTAVSGEPRDAPAAAAHDSFLSDLSF